MTGQPVLQKISPKLEVILVTGLFVPDGEDRTHSNVSRSNVITRAFGNNRTGKKTRTKEEKCH